MGHVGLHHHHLAGAERLAHRAHGAHAAAAHHVGCFPLGVFVQPYLLVGAHSHVYEAELFHVMCKDNAYRVNGRLIYGNN